jgi:hypothetical protein
MSTNPNDIELSQSERRTRACGEIQEKAIARPEVVPAGPVVNAEIQEIREQLAAPAEVLPPGIQSPVITVKGGLNLRRTTSTADADIYKEANANDAIPAVATPLPQPPLARILEKSDEAIAKSDEVNTTSGDEVHPTSLEGTRAALKTTRAALQYQKKVAESLVKHASKTKDPKYMEASEKTAELVNKLEEEIAEKEAAAKAGTTRDWLSKVHFDGSRYWVPGDSDDCWVDKTEKAMERQLRLRGWNGQRRFGGVSDVEETLEQIQQRPRIAGSLRLAGYKAGVVEMNQRRILVIESPRLIEPVKGSFPVFKEFVEGLVQKEEVYLWSWCYLAVIPMYDGELTPGQVLALAGPKNSGKSAFQNAVITPMLGGRVARPYLFMSGGTSFNGDLYEAEHLMIEDEISARDMTSRLSFGARLKQFTVNQWGQHHGKGKQAVALKPYWRMSMSLNDMAEHLAIFPPIDESLDDKIILLKAHAGAVPALVERLGGRKIFEAKLKEELPAVLYYLLHEFSVPGELRDTRMGIKGYQNPAIMSDIEGTAPEFQLLEALLTFPVRDGSGSTYTNSALGWSGTLLLMNEALRSVIPSPVVCGRYFSRLERKKVGGISSYKSGGITKYCVDFSKLPQDNLITLCRDHKDRLVAEIVGNKCERSGEEDPRGKSGFGGNG